MLTQQIRIAIAAPGNHQPAEADRQRPEVEDYLRSKYSNTELYACMDTEIRGLYYQAYTMAYDLAKKAEKLFRFERGLATPDFIQFGYWDPAHDGLLAGEQPLQRASRNSKPPTRANAATTSRSPNRCRSGNSTRWH